MATAKTTSKQPEKNKGGAPLGNTNALKWTDKKLIKLGEDLITWLNKSDKHIFFKRFLIEKGLYQDILADQESRCVLFADALKKARAIQELKLMEQSAFNKINTGVGIFLLKSIHGHTDRSEQTVIDETVKVRVTQPRPDSGSGDGAKVRKLNPSKVKNS